MQCIVEQSDNAVKSAPNPSPGCRRDVRWENKNGCCEFPHEVATIDPHAALEIAAKKSNAMARTIRFLQTLTWLPAATSVVWLTNVLAFVGHTCWGLGHWPRNQLEHVSSTAYAIHQTSVFVVSGSVLGALPVWLLLLAFPQARVSARVHLMQAGLYFAGCLAIVSYLAIDPGGFVDWFLD
jgi:hypothetical protein